MQAKGCKPDSIVYNAIIDALWDTGCAWPQRQAAVLHRRASAGGLLRRAAHAAPGYLELCLHTLTAGVAALSLYTWLSDLRCAGLFSVFPVLCSTIFPTFVQATGTFLQ